jgi:hypothetical protein
MEWTVALIAVLIVPLGMIFWWIPLCDAIGVRKANDRISHEAALMTIANKELPPTRQASLQPRAQEAVLGR